MKREVDKFMSNEKKVTTGQSKPLAVETLYTREEIEASPSTFEVRAEVLAGALRLLEGDKFSKRQVEKAVQDFKKRKVN